MKILVLFVAVEIVFVTSNFDVKLSNYQSDGMSNLKGLHNNIDLRKYNYMKEVNLPLERYVLNNNKFQPNEGRVIKYTITKIPIDEGNVVTNFNNDAYKTGFEKYILNNPNNIHIDRNGEESKIKTTYIWPDGQSASSINELIPLSADKNQFAGRDIMKVQSLSEKEEQNNQNSVPNQVKQWESSKDISNLKFTEMRETQEPAVFTKTELLSTIKSAPGRSQETKTSSFSSYLANQNNSNIYVDYVTDNKRTRETYPWNKVTLKSFANLNLKDNYKDYNILQQEAYRQPTSYITSYEMSKLYEPRSKVNNDLVYKINLQKNNERLLKPNIDMQHIANKGERNIQDTSITSLTKHSNPNENINNLIKLSETRTTQEREPIYTQTKLLSDLKTTPDQSQKIITTPLVMSDIANENNRGQNNSNMYVNYKIGTQRIRESYPWNKLILESKANKQHLKDNNIIQEVVRGPPAGYKTPYGITKLYEPRLKINNDLLYKIDLQQKAKNNLLLNPNTDDIRRDKVESLQNVQSILKPSSAVKESMPNEKEKLRQFLVQANIDPKANFELEKRDKLLSNDNTEVKKLYKSNSIVQSNDKLKIRPIESNWKVLPKYDKSELYTKIPLKHQDDEAEHILNKNLYKQYLKIYLNQVFSKVSVTINFIQKLLNLDVPNLYKILQEYAQLSISMFDVLAEIDKYYSLINHSSHQDFFAILKKYIIDDKYDNGNKATGSLKLIDKYESMNLEVNHPKHVFDDTTNTIKRNAIDIRSPTNIYSNLQFKQYQNVPILQDNEDIKNKYNTDTIRQSNDALNLKRIYDKWILQNYSQPTDINYKTTLDHRGERDREQNLNKRAYKKYLNIYLSKVFSKVSLKIDFIQKLLSLDALNLYEILKEYAQMSITMFNALEQIDTYYNLINHRSSQDFLAILRTNIIEDEEKEIDGKTAENIVNLIKKYNSQIPRMKGDPEHVTYSEILSRKDPQINVITDHLKPDGLVTKGSSNLESDNQLDNQPSASEIMPYVIEKFKPELEKEPKNDSLLKEKNEHLLHDSTDIIKNIETDNLPQSINDILKRYDGKWNNLPHYNESTEFNHKIPPYHYVDDEHKLNNNELVRPLTKNKENMQHSIDINYNPNIGNEKTMNKLSYFKKLYHKIYLNKELTVLKKRIELMQRLLSRNMLNLYDLVEEYTQIPTTMLDILTADISNQDFLSILRSDIIENYRLDNDDMNIDSDDNFKRKYVSRANLLPFILNDNFLSPKGHLRNSNCNREEAADIIRKYSINLVKQLSTIGCSKHF